MDHGTHMTRTHGSRTPRSGPGAWLRARSLGLLAWVATLASLALTACDAGPNGGPGAQVESTSAVSATPGSTGDGVDPLSVAIPSDHPLGTPEPGEVTIIAMPDIQWYSLTEATIPDDREDGRLAEFLSHFEGGPQAPHILREMQAWILEHAREQRILFVSYVGDIVERGGAPESRPRWEVTRESLDQIHGRIPYGIAVGNHDMDTATGDTRLFQEFFGADRYVGFDWYRDSFGNNENSAQRIPLDGGGPLLFLHLTCNAPEEVLEWADGVLSAHADDHVFISTHILLGPVERHSGPVTPEIETGLMRWTKCYGERGLDAQETWDRLFRRHPQIRAVLSGDQSYSQALHEVREGDAGNPILLMMTDYKQVSRDGYLRVIRYNPATGAMRVITWSPVLGQTLESTGIVPDPAKHRFDFIPEEAPALR